MRTARKSAKEGGDASSVSCSLLAVSRSNCSIGVSSGFEADGRTRTILGGGVSARVLRSTHRAENLLRYISLK